MKRADLQSNLAMTVTLIMGAMLFTTLFMGYAIYRSASTYWPPMGFAKVALGLPTFSTFLILVSSLFCYLARVATQARKVEKARLYLHLTLILGLAFMLTQGFLWSHLKATGVYVSSGIFASILYGFTWIHAAHVILGLGTLLYLEIVLKNTSDSTIRKVINVEKFWHFLGIIWLIMYFTIFVL